MIADLITGVVEGLYNIISQVIKKDQTKETVQEHIVKNEFIYQRLSNLLKTLGADRAYIKQYHNGGSYYTGLPMQKNSCTYEVVAEGISPELANNQNKLISETPSVHSSIINKKEFYVEDVELLEDPSLKQKLKDRGLKSLYVIGIWDITDNLVGLIYIDYVRENHQITELDKDTLTDFSKLITGYLVSEPVQSKNNKTISCIIVSIVLVIAFNNLFILFSNLYNLIKAWL